MPEAVVAIGGVRTLEGDSHSRHCAAPAFVLKAKYHYGLTRWNRREVLPRIVTPTLVILGHRDLVFPRSAYGAVVVSMNPLNNAEELSHQLDAQDKVYLTYDEQDFRRRGP